MCGGGYAQPSASIGVWGYARGEAPSIYEQLCGKGIAASPYRAAKPQFFGQSRIPQCGPIWPSLTAEAML
jgi:hypothetical protein